MTRRRPSPGERPGERGQAALEFAFVLPVLCLMIAAILELGLTFVSFVEVNTAARAGARKASTQATSGAGASVAHDAAKASTSLVDDSKLAVSTLSNQWVEGGEVRVRVKYPFDISILGKVVRSGEMSAEAVARIQ